MAGSAPLVRLATPEDREWRLALLCERWGSEVMVTRGVVHDLTDAPAFIASLPGQPSGLITYLIEGGECEVTSLDSIAENAGAATALLAAVEDAAREAGCRRVWLIATNDNLCAIRFYQRRGTRSRRSTRMPSRARVS